MKDKEKALADWYALKAQELSADLVIKVTDWIMDDKQIVPWADQERGVVMCKCGNEDGEKFLKIYLSREWFILICLSCGSCDELETVWSMQARIIRNLRRRLRML